MLIPLKCRYKICSKIKSGNSPGPEPEIVERQRVAKERAAQRVGSLAVQNEMRGVCRRCIKDS